MRLFSSAIGLALAAALTTASAWSTEATFQRDLATNGRVDLTVSTGAGSIHFAAGPAGHVHIFGRVRSGWGGDDDQVGQIASHPPIEQTGNIVRIGDVHQRLHNVSIDYEIQVPADTFLRASTGSGGVTDDGVGADAKLSTGSGSIRATGLQGSFSLSTGSGSIYGEQVGRGDVDAHTGSGSIELKNLDGGLRAHTGAGSIKAGGTPAGPWRIDTGTGSVEVWTGNAAFNLDAGSGTGGVRCDRQITTEGTMGHHHLTGKVGGGGPTVHIATGTGSIRIH